MIDKGCIVTGIGQHTRSRYVVMSIAPVYNQYETTQFRKLPREKGFVNRGFDNVKWINLDDKVTVIGKPEL
jgi:hypothetical protein